MTKQRIRKIPVGWRKLLPNEVVKPGDWQAPKEQDHSHFTAQEAFKRGQVSAGWFSSEQSENLYIGKKVNESFNVNWKFIRRKSPPKSVTVTSQKFLPIGTEAANGVESTTPV